MPIDDRAGGHALAAAVADDFVGDAVRRQLLDPPAMRLVAEVGEDDDVGDLADAAQGLERAGHHGLAVHLAAEEIGRAAARRGPRRRAPAVAMGQRAAEIAGFEGEVDGVRLAQPVWKWRPCAAAPRRNR